MKSHTFVKKSLMTLGLTAGILALGACKPLANDNSTSTSPKTPAVTSGKTESGDTAKTLPPTSADQLGDTATLENEFKTVAENLAKRFEAAGLYTLPSDEKNGAPLDVDGLRTHLREIKISFGDKKLVQNVDGKELEVTAQATVASKLIEVNAAQWKTLTDVERRNEVVLHAIYAAVELDKETDENSKAVIAELKLAEKPLTPEALCSVEKLGAQDADRCLLAANWVVEDSIHALEEILGTFANPDGADDEAKAGNRVKIKNYVANLKDNYAGLRDEKCEVAESTGLNSIEAAYQTSACELNFSRDRRALLIKFYNNVRLKYPEISLPRVTEEYTG